mgnify:CR=1 FL=1
MTNVIKKTNSINEDKDSLSKYVFGAPQPQNLEAESAVLAAIIISGASALVKVKDYLTIESFYLKEHAIIYKAILSLVEAQIPIDLITIREMIIKQGDSESVSSYFIAEITNHISSSVNIEYHARIVYECAAKRALIKAATSIINDAYDPTVDTISLLSDSVQRVSLAAKLPPLRKTMLQYCVDALEVLMSRLEAKDVDMTWGVPFMDERVGTPNNGDFVVIGARPGMGKTALALQIALKNAQRNKNVWFFTKEMSVEQLIIRMACSLSKIDSRLFTNKKATEKDIEKIQIAIELITKLETLTFFDNFTTIKEIETLLAISSKKPDIVIIDYLQLFTEDKQNYTIDREVGSASRTCKEMAMRGDKCIVLALSQFSRDVERRANRQPQMSDLRGSGGIEQDADMIIFPYRAAYYGIEYIDDGNTPSSRIDKDGHVCEHCRLFVEKYRNGSTGYFDCGFTLQTQTFSRYI